MLLVRTAETRKNYSGHKKSRNNAGLYAHPSLFITHLTSPHLLLHIVAEHHHAIKHVYQYGMRSINVARQYFFT